MEPYDVVVNQPVVIDNGSGVIKAGFAGEHIPKCRFPNYIGRPKHVRVMAGALEGDIFVGPKAEEHRGLLSIRYPMEHGIVTDWNDMERIWSYIYSKEQLATFTEDHPVLLTEAPLNPRRNREKAAEFFFEGINAPALFVSMQAVLSLYATGRVTGVVLDSGDGVTHAVPIYEGFAMPHSIMRVDIAGRDVTRYLKTLIRREGFNFRSTAEFEIVRSIKEKVCYLATNPQKEEAVETEKFAYKLPDGKTFEIGQARFRAPEVLFRPDLLGEECEGIHDVLMYSIEKSDMDLRKMLYQNIVLSGGSTLFKGFGDRLLSELRKHSAKDLSILFDAHFQMKAMDANRYATKKTIAQGMLDIALLTANASQLKYILQVGEQHQFYKLMLILISLSIVMQVAAGVLLVVQSLVSIAKSQNRSILFTVNHFVDAFIFLSVFCDIIKMNFGLDPAIPYKVDEVEVFKT